ncbi:MAG TPA: nucleotidyltransferase domain-containing protein [Phototrophicaceae bacterium]|nr:nucleotidyltransferase domain-containing protein [Phototrophicaceae bacterium]
MHTITTFEPDFEKLLPETYALLAAANLTVHDGVKIVVLEGSRGLQGRPRPDSDVDLSLVVDTTRLPSDEPAREEFLRAVIDTTLSQWRGPVELDTAAVFDMGHGLDLFEIREYDPAQIPDCPGGCFGLYKTQKGFNGYVPPSMIELPKIYPLLVIWRRS